MFHTRILAALVLGIGAAGCYDDAPKGQPPMDTRATVQTAVPPPPVSGGTLVIADAGTVAVVADPDRDRVVIVDLVLRNVRGIIELNAGDEPGRVVVQDSIAYVALRRGAGVAVIDLAHSQWVGRLGVCPNPRGLALEEGLLHVACASGDLVSVSTLGGEVVRRVDLGPDLRDVVVVRDGLMVSRFRSAELLLVDPEGNLVGSTFPTSAVQSLVRRFATATEPATFDERLFTPSVAWRMISNGQGGVLLLHQRGLQGVVKPPGEAEATPRGSWGGGSFACAAPVHVAVSEFPAGLPATSSASLRGLTLGVDLALSTGGSC